MVVGVALLDGRTPPRALVACRRQPPALAGCWEFPGGKVEPGERDEAALIRECREELALEVTLVERLGGDLPLPSGAVLRVWTGHIVGGIPSALEHAELRWVTAAEVDALRWIPADRPLAAELRRLLTDQG